MWGYWDEISAQQYLRIVGVPRTLSTKSPTAAVISTLLKEALKLEKEPLLDRAHHTLQPKPKPGECPRPIIAYLHYHMDCIDILQPSNGLSSEIRLSLSSQITLWRQPGPETPSMTFTASSVRFQGYDLACYTRHTSMLHMLVSKKEFKSPEDARAFIVTPSK